MSLLGAGFMYTERLPLSCLPGTLFTTASLMGEQGRVCGFMSVWGGALESVCVCVRLHVCTFPIIGRWNPKGGWEEKGKFSPLLIYIYKKTTLHIQLSPKKQLSEKVSVTTTIMKRLVCSMYNSQWRCFCGCKLAAGNTFCSTTNTKPEHLQCINRENLLSH